MPIQLLHRLVLRGFQRQSEPAVIDARIGGYWSAHVFDAAADGWQRAQDRLSTVQKSFDIDAGGTTHLTPWAVKATPDYSYTAAGHIDGSGRLQLANSRDIHNRVLIRFDFRFQRLRQRDIQRNWMMSPGIGCEYLQNPFTLPRKSMIQSAAEATGWAVPAINFVDLPLPQHFQCTPAGGGATYVLGWGFKVVGNNSTIPNPEAIEPFCQGAFIKLGKRWAQSVTEEYIIDLRAPQSIGQIGEIAREDYRGLEAAQETEGWETDADYTAPTAGAVLHRNGDHVLDADTDLADGRSAMETAIQTLQAIHKTGILASHRRNVVSWRTLIQPQLALRHTVRLQTSALTAKGKVAQLVHAGSLNTGDATTEIRIALSRSRAVGALGDDPLDPPQAPDTQVDTIEDPTPSLSYGGAGMHIGGTTTAPPFDEAWTGLVTNHQWDPTVPDRFATDPDLPQTVTYPVQFRIQVPEIEAAARQWKRNRPRSSTSISPWTNFRWPRRFSRSFFMAFSFKFFADSGLLSELTLGASVVELDANTPGAALSLGTEILSEEANATPMFMRIDQDTHPLGTYTDLKLQVSQLDEEAV